MGNKLMSGPGKKVAHKEVVAERIEKAMKTLEIPEINDEADFFQAVYKLLEKISIDSGAMQYQIPDKKKLRDAFEKIHTQSNRELNKEEFAKIIGEVITPENIYFGAAAMRTVLTIFGVPILATLAKRSLPGPTAYISEDVLIPGVTIGTVLILAKTNKL